MGSHRKTPPSVKKALYSDWWFEPAWQQMHNTNAGNNLGVVVGPNGSGKSWLLGLVGETLGVDVNDEHTLFRTENLNEHLFFDSRSLINQCNKLMKFPKRTTVGYQLLLDEAQLSLYSKEAFNEEVKNLSRLLMTIRSRRWGVYINLPSFGMLNKDVRLITNWLVEMRGKPSEYSYGTYYEIHTNMFTSEPYRQKPVFSSKFYTVDGIPMVQNVTYSVLPFPKPSLKFVRPYEKLKAEHQKLIYEKFGFIQEKIEAKETGLDKKPSTDYSSMAKEVIANPSLFQNKKTKEFIIQRLVGRFNIGRHTALHLKSIVTEALLKESVTGKGVSL